MGRIVGGLALLAFGAVCGLFWYVEAEGGGRLEWGEFVIGAREMRGLPLACFLGMLCAVGGGLYTLFRHPSPMLLFDGAALIFLAWILVGADSFLPLERWSGLPLVLLLAGAGSIVLAATRLKRRAPLSAAGKLEG